MAAEVSALAVRPHGSFTKLNMHSTILATNVNTNHPDIYTAATTVATAFDIQHSIIGAKNDGDIVISNTSTDQIGVTMTLSPLGNYGGPTKTHALLPSSPALDKGSNVQNEDYDQRGITFPRVTNGGIANQADIGAVEGVLLPPTVTSVVFGDGTNQRSMVKQIVVTFSEAVSFSPNVVSAFSLTRTGTGLPNDTVALTANPATGPASS